MPAMGIAIHASFLRRDEPKEPLTRNLDTLGFKVRAWAVRDLAGNPVCVQRSTTIPGGKR